MPMPIPQVSFGAGELAPNLHARFDLAKYAVGAKAIRNGFVHAQGGMSNRPGTQIVAPADGFGRLVPFAFSTTQTYVLMLGDETARVARDGGAVLETAKTITAISQANPAAVTVAAHGWSNGTLIYLSGVGGMTELNERFFLVAGALTDAFTLQDMFGAAVDSSAFTAFTTGGEAARVYAFDTPWPLADLPDLDWTQSADVMTMVSPLHVPQELARTGHAAWSVAPITFAPSQPAPTSLSASATATGKTFKYKVTAENEETAEESLPTAELSVNGPSSWTVNDKVTLTWTAATGAGRYHVYKEKNGVFGFIGTADGTEFVDDNIEGDFDDTPPGARNPFDGAGKYPTATAYHQQRHWYAASTDSPQTVWATQTGNYKNMSKASPAKDDDAVTFTIAADQVNAIRHIIPAKDLLLLTVGGEWVVRGAGENSAITPSSIDAKRHGTRGASAVRPVVVGDTVLFVQAKGSVVRDLRYSLDIDGYSGTDVTILANHLLEGRSITRMAYAEVPHGLVWCVRDDGKLLCLTYQRDHDVYAWSLHETDGTVIDIAVIAEGEEDILYLLVDREVDGDTRRFLERMPSRRFETVADCYFVDCGARYDLAAPATKLWGMDHLKGRTVAILADGNVHPPLVVAADGSVTLNYAASKVSIGLGYRSYLSTLPVGGSEAAGRLRNIGKVGLHIKDTRGLKVGPRLDMLNTLTPTAPPAFNQPIALVTDLIEVNISTDWRKLDGVVVVQDNPLPMTILSVIPEVTVAGGR